MSQISRKFIENNAVNGQKFRLDNEQALRARNAADNADIDVLQVNGSDVLELLRTLSAGGFRITNAGDPIDPQDVATRAFVEAASVGFSDAKDPVRVATTEQLNAGYNNGAAGVGATLVALANGALVVDGVTLDIGDRLLVKDQVETTHNGIYVVSDTGSVSTPFTITRSTDADDSPEGEVTYGMFCAVVEGADNGQQAFFLATNDPITLGTTGLVFVRFSENILAGAGLTKTGSTLSIDAGAGLAFNGNELEVNVNDSANAELRTLSAGATVDGLRGRKVLFTLTGIDISNGYVDLDHVAHIDSVQVLPVGGPVQVQGQDYTVNYTGGTGGFTRISFAGDLTTLLVAGDEIEVQYQAL